MIFINILLATLYFFTGKASFELFSGYKIVSIGVFPPEGIALAFALFYGKKIIPGIFIGQFILAYSSNIPLIPSIEISLINSIEALIAIIFFNKFNLSNKLKTFRDIIGLFGMIIFILQPFSAILSNIMLFIHSLIELKNIFILIFSWWFGNIMGQFLFAPFVLLLFNNYKKIYFKEFLLYGIFFGLYLYILEIVLRINNPFIIMSLSLAIIIIVIVKKDMLYGVYFTIISAIISSVSVYLKVGAFSSYSITTNTINYNLFLLSHIIIVLILGILFQERKEQEEILKQKIKEEIEKNKKQQLLMLQQSRLAQMGEMISMIAHQWRQPLNSLSMLNQAIILKYKMNKLNDEFIEEFKTKSKKIISNMSKTIDDFRDFFKPQKEKVKYCINDVIKDLIYMIEPILDKNNIKIIYKEENRYELLGYPNELGQAILNILNNAKDALIENNIKNKQITIISYKENNFITLKIQDNAGGIPEEIIDKIFDPYFSTKDKNGTGIGLYMTKIIIDEHLKGKIEVKNSDNGAMFIITLKDFNES